MNQQKTAVILGGNGKTGSRVASRLRALGRTARVASRSTPVPFDWEDERTWPKALEAADSLYLTYYPDLALPEAAERVDRISRLAARSGIERIVLLAGRGEPQVRPAEEAVRASGTAFTILECAFFCQNFSEGFLAPVQDTVVFPAGDVREPFIDCDDIADVAVLALTDAGHSGKTYELTGPVPLTFAEATATLATATSRPLCYQQLTYDAYGALLREHLPEPEVRFLLELFADVLDGHNAHATTDVERLLGRPAKSFEAFARDVAAAARAA